eukprot:scaffold324223_cov86-Tisochrysis_lutea.AAC.1
MAVALPRFEMRLRLAGVSGAYPVQQSIWMHEHECCAMEYLGLLAAMHAHRLEQGPRSFWHLAPCPRVRGSHAIEWGAGIPGAVPQHSRHTGA